MTLPELPDGYEHGTTRAYPRCRPTCDECRAANSAAAAARRAARIAEGMPEKAHGTPAGYTYWNCRCKRCNKVARARSKARPRTPRVKPDLVIMPEEDHGTRRGYGYWDCPCAPCRTAGTTMRADARARKRAEHHGPVEIRRYSYRIYPESDALDNLRRVFGSCRFVYNSYIALARERHAAGGKHPSGYDAAKTLVTEARRNPDTAWLAEVSHTALTAAVHDAADAYQRFFDSAAGKIKGRRVGHPRFKSRRTARKSARFAENAFTIRGGWQNAGRGGGRLHLASIGQDIAVNWHRTLPGYPSAATVREDPDGKFWVSFIVRVPVERPKQPTRGPRAAGIDVGLNDYAAITYSDGTREKIANPRHYRQAEDRLRRADKILSRKTPGSNNYAKVKRARARAHRRVANLRENHARQLASKLSRENQTVVIETLNIAGMANTNMAKSINDAGWGQFLRFLEEHALARVSPSSRHRGSTPRHRFARSAVRAAARSRSASAPGRAPVASPWIATSTPRPTSLPRGPRSTPVDETQDFSSLKQSRMKQEATDPRVILAGGSVPFPGACRQVQIRGNSTVSGVSWKTEVLSVESAESPLLRALLPTGIADFMNPPTSRLCS